MRTRAFPRDAIEATTARLKYGLSNATYSPLAAQLHAWRVGSATFHSDSEIRRAIRQTARYEPPRTNVSPSEAAA